VKVGSAIKEYVVKAATTLVDGIVSVAVATREFVTFVAEGISYVVIKGAEGVADFAYKVTDATVKLIKSTISHVGEFFK